MYRPCTHPVRKRQALRLPSACASGVPIGQVPGGPNLILTLSSALLPNPARLPSGSSALSRCTSSPGSRKHPQTRPPCASPKKRKQGTPSRPRSRRHAALAGHGPPLPRHEPASQSQPASQLHTELALQRACQRTRRFAARRLLPRCPGRATISMNIIATATKSPGSVGALRRCWRAPLPSPAARAAPPTPPAAAAIANASPPPLRGVLRPRLARSTADDGTPQRAA